MIGQLRHRQLSIEISGVRIPHRVWREGCSTGHVSLADDLQARTDAFADLSIEFSRGYRISVVGYFESDIVAVLEASEKAGQQAA